MLTITVILAITPAILSTAYGGIICPSLHPPVPIVPVHPIGGIFEIFGGVPLGGMVNYPAPPGGFVVGKYGGLQVGGKYGGVPLDGKYGGLPFGGKWIVADPGVYDMSMHNFYPGMGNYQYYQYNYGPSWNGNLQGTYAVLVKIRQKPGNKNSQS